MYYIIVLYFILLIISALGYFMVINEIIRGIFLGIFVGCFCGIIPLMCAYAVLTGII